MAKIVTASNGKKTIKMSKAEWEQVGIKSGWMKKIAEDFSYEKPLPPLGRIPPPNKVSVPQHLINQTPVSKGIKLTDKNNPGLGTCQFVDKGLLRKCKILSQNGDMFTIQYTDPKQKGVVQIQVHKNLLRKPY